MISSETAVLVLLLVVPALAIARFFLVERYLLDRMAEIQASDLLRPARLRRWDELPMSNMRFFLALLDLRKWTYRQFFPEAL